MGKWLDRKPKVNSKIYDFTTWETNIYNVHIAQHLRNFDSQTMKFGQLVEYNLKVH